MKLKNKHSKEKSSSSQMVKMKVTYTRPLFTIRGKKPRVIIINAKKLGMVAVCLFTAVIVGLLINTNKMPNSIKDNEHFAESVADEGLQVTSPNQNVENNEIDIVVEELEDEQESDQEKEFPIIDLSGNAVELKSSVDRINEPTPFDGEIIYSGGNAPTIDEPVFKQLYMYNINTGEENVVADTQIKFGEIYEGRFNKDWVVWLDTNQSGTNDLYVLNRKTNEVSKIKSCNFNKPKLQLWGDNLVWVEQIDAEQDRLYLYNFKSGEPVSLESFSNPTYGTCPPAISNDILVWVCPGEDQSGNSSVIKKLDLSKALSIPQEGNDLSNQEGGATAQGEGATPEQVDEEIIDPQGFAIYPATNGKVIAWLDNLDPSKANLKMTADDGKNIITIAHGVARPFGVGDDFVAYMQNDSVMVYFWETGKYARLTAPGEKGRLSVSGVQANTVVWYDANDNNRKDDIVKICVLEKSLLDE